MNKFIVFLLCALFFGSCNEEEDSIYYPLDNVDIIKGGSEEPTGNATLIAESHNLESYVLDTLAVYPYDKTIGKLTFKFDPKNAVSDVTMEGFRGEGKSEMGMSNSYYDGNFPEEYRQPIFMNDNPAKKYRVKFRLKGEFRYYTEHWYTDYIYMMLSASFLPYPPAVSEHGIYTREREEEVIKASWIAGIYKDLWIDQFKKMSLFAYDKADRVTSLYGTARRLQIELGCSEEKIMITPNGIDQKRFKDIPMKEPDDEYINVGAVLRVTPIKDVKTMIMAFGYAKNNNPKLKLWIMGPTDEDEDYAKECFDLVEDMQIKDVIFTGRINTSEYIGKMDFTILTSISEGQPLTILEGYAAHKPAIATDVGNCRGLIYGEDDPYGPSGIVTHIMNVEEIKEAILFLANNPETCKEYGENGYKRLIRRYTIVDMKNTYDGIYTELSESMTD